ncbi:hypothetical protein EV175_006662, partial [Coemansia sp. RSA 1933]
WSYVADLLGSRTDNQCWRHWRSLHKQGRAPDPPEDVDDSGPEEGTVPTFPEWEEERRRRRMRGSLPPSADTADSADADADAGALLGFAHTQGTGRKRKTTSGIESARKRQWKRATSTNFVPLLASPTERRAASPADSVRPPPRSKRAKSTGSVLLQSPALDSEALAFVGAADATTPTRSPGGRAAWGRLASGADSLASPGASVRRGSGMRRGRVLNWNSILHVGAEAKTDAAEGDADAHSRPVLPCGGTAQGLQRLVAAIPEVAAAFNAELVGIDDDHSEPSLDSLPMSFLRQRIEALFIWPLMLGTIDPRKQQ